MAGKALKMRCTGKIKTMKKLLTILSLATVASVLTGCIAQQVPRLRLTINPATHEVDLSNPKDTTVHNFHAEVTTNGTSLVTFESLTTVMNPTVITETGKAQASEFTAVGEQVRAAVKDGLEAYATMGASSAASSTIDKAIGALGTAANRTAPKATPTPAPVATPAP